MTNQSPDQSNSQSQSDTPRTDAVRLRDQSSNFDYEHMTEHAKNLERELNAARTQSPAPSKEMEELPPSRTTGEAIERLLTLAGISVEAGWTFMDGNVPRKLDEVRERIMELYNAPLAAELGKEREAVEAFIKHVGAKTFEEARDVLLRTKAQDEDKIEEMFNRNKELGRDNAQLKRELAEAREESAYLRKSTEGHEKTIGDCHDELRKLRAQLLALSAARTGRGER